MGSYMTGSKSRLFKTFTEGVKEILEGLLAGQMMYCGMG